MQYFNVTINHNFESLPEHLIGMEAYIPREGHFVITGVTPKVINAVAVLIDIPKPNTADYVRTMMARVPYLLNNAKGGNVMTDPAEQVIAFMVDTLADHKEIWSNLSISKISTASFMRAILETGRNYPEKNNPQPDCRDHLVSMFKNVRIITEDMQNDPVSIAEAQKVTSLPESVKLGKVYVLSAHFPTVTNALAAELLRRYNVESARQMTDLKSECLSDRDTLWKLRKFFNQTDNPITPNQGWLIELGFVPEDSFSMKIISDFLTPKLAKMAEETLVIITTDSEQVAKQLKHRSVVLIDGKEVKKSSS